MECVVRVSSRWWGASLGPTVTTAARETIMIQTIDYHQQQSDHRKQPCCLFMLYTIFNFLMRTKET